MYARPTLQVDVRDASRIAGVMRDPAVGPNLSYARAMRASVLVLCLVSVGCKRDEPPPPPTPVVIDASVTASAEPIPSASTTASASATASASTDAGSVDAGVDTSKWEPKELDALGTAKFSFNGTIMFPKGTKTRASGATTGGGDSAGTFAFLQLPSGVEVMLSERSASSMKDGSFEKQLVGQTSRGKLIVDRSDANGFFFAYETSDGVLVQGASWAVQPGFGCGTRKPVARANVDEVAAICASLRPKPKK